MLEFYSVGRVVFGNGAAQRLREIYAGMGSRPLLVHNVSDEAVLGRIRSGLPGGAVYRQRGEPRTMDVDAAAALARGAGCDSVVGLGGGSAIDCAKAVAGLLGNGGEALDYMEVVGKGLKITRPAAPWIAIPTTAGTGAEVTRNAVIAFPEKRFKASIRSELLLPKVALVDPELGVGVRAEITARSGMDALCQCIESYTSKNANALSDALAAEGMELAARWLRRAFADGSDLQAREGMAMAALISGITLTNVGLGAVHGFAAPMGALFPIPHGTICALLLPGVLEANIAAMRESRDGRIGKYVKVGRVLAGGEMLSEEEALAACGEETAALVRELKIPSLTSFGVGPADVPQIVDLAKKSSSMKYNPVALSEEALAQILERALAG